LVVDEELRLRPDTDKIIAAARRHLCFLLGESDAVDLNILQGPSLPRVNVTLRTSGMLRGSMSGCGDTFREQLLDAVYRSSRDSRFTGSIVTSDIHNVSVEVWLQLSADTIPLEQRENPDAIHLGQDGVDVEQGTASAYYKPSVALTSHFTTPQDMFSALCKKANLPPDAWKMADCRLRRSSWIHLCETPGGKFIELNALRVNKSPAITLETMVEWAERCVSYFKENQYTDGSFCYLYRPFSNSERRGATNPVRESGCAYAMAEAASSPHLSYDPNTVMSAKRAIAAILRRSIQLETGGSYIADSLAKTANGKLGTTALALLALLTPEFRESHNHEIDKLLIGIKSAQMNNGLFEGGFGQRDTSVSEINFFPGQALLALVKRAEQGDVSCRDIYRRSFVPHRDHFRKSPATAFVGWQADVWTRAALLDSNHEYAEFVFEQIDWLLQFQLHPDSDHLSSGGFSWNGKPPQYSSIVYTEAVARGVDLAYRLGDSRWTRYKEAFQAGIRFCSRLRLTEEQSIFFPHPTRAIGGMALSLSDFEVRSDVVQHTITLALAVLERPVLFD